jgi:hypothetical protein
MNPQDPLAQLRDIHLPDPVSWWPPAPGWWLLAILVIGAIVAAVRWGMRRHRALAYRRQALLELEQAFRLRETDGDELAFLRTANAILKRAALQSFPRAELASLHGEAWAGFLDSHWRSPPERSFSDSDFAAMIYADSASPATSAEIYALGTRWLRQLRGAGC